MLPIIQFYSHEVTRLSVSDLALQCSFTLLLPVCIVHEIDNHDHHKFNNWMLLITLAKTTKVEDAKLPS